MVDIGTLNSSLGNKRRDPKPLKEVTKRVGAMDPVSVPGETSKLVFNLISSYSKLCTEYAMSDDSVGA